MEENTLLHDTECEKIVLGTILTYRNAFDDWKEYLNIHSFYDFNNQEVYKACCRINERGEEISIVSVLPEMMKAGIKADGIAYYVATLPECASTSQSNQYPARLSDLEKRRRMWAIGQKLVRAGISEADDLYDVYKEVTDELSKFFMEDSTNILDLHDTITQVYDQIRANLSNSAVTTGTPTGFPRLDEKGGFHGSDLIIVGGESSNGKALAMDEPILTVDGWKQNKDLCIGDKLASVDGEPSEVVGIYPQGIRDMYLITFSDGRTAKCSDEHLWDVAGYAGWHGSTKVLTTMQLKELIEKPLVRKATAYIPNFCGVYGRRKNFMIHPYIIGVLIGDGCLTRGTIIANNDKYVAEKVARLSGIGTKVLRCKDRCNVISISTQRGQTNPYRDELRRLGLYGHTAKDKFIPDEYMDACREQRLELLNGLMDTDGTIAKDGGIYYSTSSLQLAKDVQRLGWSLGYRAYLSPHKSVFNGKRYDDHYRVVLCSENDSEIFTLPRKAMRTRNRARVHNCIRSIEYIGREECQCIKVSHPRELFVMKDFIVTHNTSFAQSVVANAINNGSSVAYYSMEMTAMQLTVRMLSMQSGISSSTILYGRPNEFELAAIDKAVGQLAGKTLLFDERSTSNIDTIINSIRMMKKRFNICGAVVDYLQILSVNSRMFNKEQQMGEAARRLKNLAKELDIWVVALSQLNRDKDNPEPNINRMRDSGQIAEAADVVILVYRPEKYGKRYSGDFSAVETKDTALIDVAKGRNIGTFKFICGFNAPCTKFYPLDDGLPIATQIEEDAPF